MLSYLRNYQIPLISTKFSPNGSSLVADHRSDLCFPIFQGAFPQQSIWLGITKPIMHE